MHDAVWFFFGLWTGGTIGAIAVSIVASSGNKKL